MNETNRGMSMNRRNFLKNSALGVGAALGTDLVFGQEQQPTTPAPQPELKIKGYRTLGRTGFKVSDISCGYIKDPAVLERLLDTGVNYIDAAENYENEEMIGSVLKKRDRKSIFLTTKLIITNENATKDDFVSRAYQALKRLQVDFVDCLMIHSCENMRQLKNEAFHAAAKQLKAEGKIKYFGLSNHGSNFYVDPEETMEKILVEAAKDGRFDVMQLAYNFIQDDKGDAVIKICKENNIGTVIMKTNPIGNTSRLKARLEQFKKEGKEIPPQLPSMIAKLEDKEKRSQEFIQKYRLNDAKRMRDAAIRFVLSNPDAHTISCSFHNFDGLDAFIPLSGTTLSDMEKIQLAAYKEACGSYYCRHACGLCEPACPHHVPVNTIMRFKHYFEAQGKEKYAMKNYAHLAGPKADICLKCAGHCESACPFGVPVHSLLCMAHHTLTIA